MRISDKHNKIIQAAIKVFARKGFFSARISDIAKKAKDVKVKECVFDRGGYLYHGRVKTLAEAAREGGLQF